MGSGRPAFDTCRKGVRTVPIRVVVGEDNYLAREAIARVLEAEDDIEIVASSSDLDSLRRAVEEEEPDVVLADIQMPPAGSDEGIRLANELRTTHPEIGVVILSQHAEPIYATELLAAGAGRRAYLLKERIQHREEVTRAVREVAGGGSVLDPLIVELLLTSARARDASRFESLTARETDVLVLVAEGWSNAGIGEQLGITTRAVERHISSIFSKLDLGDSSRHNPRVRAALLYLAEYTG
jgi:DNA-binding NarL/FixJ family response regulator